MGFALEANMAAAKVALIIKLYYFRIDRLKDFLNSDDFKINLKRILKFH